MPKRYKNGQTREGVAERRALEYAVVRDQVKRRRDAFMARIYARLERDGDCLCFAGTLDHKGYARLNFRYNGQHVTIGAHRLFLILKIKKPIPLEYEAGHMPECNHRNCVKHLRLEHYKSNAATRGKR